MTVHVGVKNINVPIRFFLSFFLSLKNLEVSLPRDNRGDLIFRNEKNATSSLKHMFPSQGRQVFNGYFVIMN